MTCKHLKHLFDYCQTNQLQLSSGDLIRIICPQCGEEEVCPSMLEDEYDTRHPTAPPTPGEKKICRVGQNT